MLRKAPRREPIRASALAEAAAAGSVVKGEARGLCVRRQASGRHLLEELARDDEALDLGGALVDLGDSRVAVVALGRHLGHVPHATKHLERMGEGRSEARRAAQGSANLSRKGEEGERAAAWMHACAFAVAASEAASLAMAASLVYGA